MTQHATKLSISLPADLAEAVRRRVGARGLSRFVAQALAHELEHAQLGTFLRELDAEHGPVPEEALEAARRAWPRGQAST